MNDLPYVVDGFKLLKGCYFLCRLGFIKKSVHTGKAYHDIIKSEKQIN